ncbi:hypothetical protein BU14_0244s0022 [Porphyra umbilicalis]|uniref:Uncharacterized protein n=1 Tax=Porphyra umbilicalis TaxID=2786 RepID=A0A1X6P319_PORUM|nr:hypothetical protein BU14_0244s0022 [Porphyra umbilicalis]|eukprot:OSX75261.1 hypothetical protein BU14_0244s0022 [Porphyra umbilicalis]
MFGDRGHRGECGEPQPIVGGTVISLTSSGSAVCCGANRLLRLCLVPTGICFASFVWEGAGGGDGRVCEWRRDVSLDEGSVVSVCSRRLSAVASAVWVLLALSTTRRGSEGSALLMVKQGGSGGTVGRGDVLDECL